MRFILASAFFLPLVCGLTGHGAVGMAEPSPQVAQVLVGDHSAEGDTVPDLVLAANGKKKGP
jgi:hypothetical protein